MTAYYNEIDPYAAQWLRNLIKAGLIAPGDVDERSINDVQPDDLRGYTQCHFFAGIGVWSYALRRAGIPDDRPLWTGSCPCQPWSTAGKALGDKDERHLWPAWFRLISESRPVRILGEQVANGDGYAWLDLVGSDVEGIGYTLGAVCSAACGFGAPHIRQRLYFVAVAEDAHGRRGERGAEAGIGANAERRRRYAGSGATNFMDNPISNGRGKRGGDNGSDDRDQPTPTVRLVGNAAEGGQREPRCALGDTQQSGLEGHNGDGDHGDEPGRHGQNEARPAAAAGGDGGSLVYSAGIRRKMEIQHTGSCFAETCEREANERRGGSEPNATNGFWRNAEWIACSDGKARAIESRLAKVAPRATGGVGFVCADEADQEGKIDDQNVRCVQEGFQNGVQPLEVLQPRLHGGGANGRDQGDERQEQSPPVGQATETVLRVLREEGAARPPQGLEFAEQRAIEFTDFVRLLPSSYSLAKFCGDAHTAETVRALLEGISEAWFVQYASDPAEAIWRSLTQETQDRVRMGFDAGGWITIAVPPLVVGAQSRVGRLRAYGNTINVEAAAEFIRAFLACELLDTFAK